MENVIFIPGITGTTLVNSNSLDFDTIYSGVQKYYEKLEQIKLQINADDDEQETVIVERSNVEAIAYREILKLFPPENYRVYIFGYDWRKSNGVSAVKLQQYVDMLRRKLKNPNEKFHFITHSMGALVFSAYLKLCENDYSSINRVVLTVPPFLGAVEALKGLVMGKWSFVDTKASFRKVARTFPGMYELLPKYNIAPALNWDKKYKGGVTMNNSSANIFDPNIWQSNIYRDEPVKADKEMIEKRLKDAEYFRLNSMMDFTQLPQSIRDRMLILVGEDAKTLSSVIVEPTDSDESVNNYYDFEGGLYVKDSDGTVPSISCHYYKDSILTLSVKSRLIDLLGQHANFLNYDRVQILIDRFLKLDKWDEAKRTESKLPGTKWWMIPDGTVKVV